MTIQEMFDKAKPSTSFVTDAMWLGIDDARRFYKPGEISEKTGLQKQPDGSWAKPGERAAKEKKEVYVTSAENFKKLGKPITTNEALKQTNPKYATGGFGYQNNCQRCCATYEMIKRGYNVTALPIGATTPAEVASDVFTDYFDNAFAKMYDNPEIQEVYTKKGSSIAWNIEMSMQHWGDGARCEIVIVDRYTNAHIFMAEQENGKTHYIDPQTNVEYDRSFFNKASKDGDYPVKYFRTYSKDPEYELKFNDLIDLCCQNKEAENEN